ncbi:MAG: hypothetical protein ABSF64_33905 [Bryobacteraceae bacterium]
MRQISASIVAVGRWSLRMRQLPDPACLFLWLSDSAFSAIAMAIQLEDLGLVN